MKELLKEELKQLASYVDDIERNEMWYGNKAEFEERHEKIKVYLHNLIHKNEN